MQNYFKILGLQPGANKQEIKRAYRRLAFKYHPDKNKTDGAEQRFLEISEAYEVLTSPIRNKRTRRSKAEHEKQKQEEVKKAREKARENLRKRYNEFKRQEEEAQKKQYTLGIYLLVSIVLLILISYTSYYSWFDSQAYTNSDTVIGRVTFVDYRSFNIKFFANGKKEHLTKNGSRSFEDLNGDNGMPIEVGEEFLVVYNKENPKYFDVLYEPLTKQTYRIYEQKTIPKIRLWLHENGFDFDQYRAQCVFDRLYATFGVEGLAYDPGLRVDNTGQRWMSARRPELYKPLAEATGQEVDIRTARFSGKGA